MYEHAHNIYSIYIYINIYIYLLAIKIPVIISSIILQILSDNYFTHEASRKPSNGQTIVSNCL